jgi:hypothetical protein
MSKFIGLFRKLVVFTLILIWVFLAWPQILDFPPDIKETKAASAVGDIYIARAPGTSLISNIDGTENTLTYDTEVSPSDSITRQSGNQAFRILSSGRYLIIANTSFNSIDIGNNNRHVMRTSIKIGGIVIPSIYGMASGYGRDSGGSDEDGVVVSVYIDHTYDAGTPANNDITVHVQNFGDISVSLADQFADRSGVQIIRLPDDSDYLKVKNTTGLSYSGLLIEGTPDPTWNEFGWTTQDIETDNAVIEWVSGNDITLKTAGKYMVLYSIHSTASGSRTGAVFRLNLSDAEIQASRTYTYVRNSDNNLDGWAQWGGVIDASANDILNIDWGSVTELDNTGSLGEAAITVIKLPDIAEYVKVYYDTNRAGETEGAFPFNQESFDTDDVHDNSTNNSRISGNADDHDWLLFGSWFSRTTSSDGTRVGEHFRWYRNGTEIQYGSGFSYHRGEQNPDTNAAARHAAVAVIDLGSSDYIEFNLRQEITGDQNRDFMANTVGVSGIALDTMVAAGGNTAPNFTTSPAESAASDTTTPTNVGSNTTWLGTANDTNGDNYYLLICSSDSATPGTGGGAPSCGGTQYCVSSSTADDAQATCNRIALIGDSESNTWYGFACDAAASEQACNSTGDQGTGSSGSPFETNHAPTFSTYTSADLSQDPGETVTWTTFASDSDTSSADTVSFYVCTTASFTGGGSPACGATELCSQTGQGSDPSCGYVIPTPTPDSTGNTAYGYIVDSHGFVSIGAPQGTNQAYIVNNVAPTIAAANIQLKDTDGSGDLTLTTSNGETQDFLVDFIVTDNNSCDSNEISSAIMHARLSSISSANCDSDGEDDTDNCYANAQAGTGGQCFQYVTYDSCSGTSDATVGWRCEFPLNYNTEPTVTGSTQAADTWRVAIQVTDDDAAPSSLVDDIGSVEVGMFMSYALTSGSPIVYGSVDATEDSTEQTLTMESRGNVGLDVEMSGGNGSGDGMCVSDYPTCAGLTIDTTQQVYNLTSAQGWSSGTAFTNSATEAEMNVTKPTSVGNGSDSIYMYLRVPSGTGQGSYSGQNVIAGVTGESISW